MAVMVPPRSLRLHWDADNGWILDVPWTMPTSFVRKAAEYALPRQIDRWRSLPPGEKKDDLKSAIEKLKRFEVRQNVVGANGNGTGDLVIFSGMRN